MSTALHASSIKSINTFYDSCWLQVCLFLMGALIVVVVPDGTQGIKGLSLSGSGLHAAWIQTPAVTVLLSHWSGTLAGPSSPQSGQWSTSNLDSPALPLINANEHPSPLSILYKRTLNLDWEEMVLRNASLPSPQFAGFSIKVIISCSNN